MTGADWSAHAAMLRAFLSLMLANLNLKSCWTQFEEAEQGAADPKPNEVRPRGTERCCAHSGPSVLSGACLQILEGAVGLGYELANHLA
jgi:hypothetical protein